MRKFSALLLALIIVIGICSCAKIPAIESAPAETTSNATLTENSSAPTETANSAALTENSSAPIETANSAALTENNSAPIENNSDFIGESKAKTIALNHAVLTEAEVTVEKLTWFYRQGQVVYDIEFLSATTKYTYEINAASGEVIAFYLEDLHNSGSPQLSESNNSGNIADNGSVGSDQYIGNDNAKRIALNHAGLSENSVRELNIKLDKDDGRMIYKIQFYHGGMEYQYQIDPATGDILRWVSEED